MICKPESMDFSQKNLIMILSGLPGVGKTTLALSAPGVLLIDADEGMARIQPAHRRDCSMVKTYEELLADVKSAKGAYQTLVIDTGGALIDLMKDWAVRNEPKASKTGGGISLQGYGFVKTEFARLFAELRRDFNVILLFHVAAERRDEETFFDIICEGAAKNMVWQPADLGAYLQIIKGERYLGFTPTMNYNAKSAYGIKGLMKVPELAPGDPNTFLTKLFEKVKENIRAESDTLKPQQEAYAQVMAQGREFIFSITDAQSANLTKDLLGGLTHALTSKKELADQFKKRLAELSIVWDKEAKAYVQQ